MDDIYISSVLFAVERVILVPSECIFATFREKRPLVTTVHSPAVFDLLRRGSGRRCRRGRLELPGNETAVRYAAIGQTVKIPLLLGRDFPLELHEAGRLQGVSGRQSSDFQQAQHHVSWLAVKDCKKGIKGSLDDARCRGDRRATCRLRPRG